MLNSGPASYMNRACIMTKSPVVMIPVETPCAAIIKLMVNPVLKMRVYPIFSSDRLF